MWHEILKNFKICHGNAKEVLKWSLGMLIDAEGC